MELIINTLTSSDNTAQMLDYQLNRAAAMLEGSGWELKGYNRNQPRGKTTPGTNAGSFAPADSRFAPQGGMVIASPHQDDEGLSYTQAIARIDSPRHQAFLKVMDEIHRAAGIKPSSVIHGAGMYQHAGENISAATYPQGTSHSAVRAAGAALAYAANQKEVLIMKPDENGDHAIHHLEIPEGKMQQAFEAAEKNLTAYTLMPDKVNPNKGILIIAENQYSGSLEKEAKQIANELGTHHEMIRGAVEFLGDPDERTKASENLARVASLHPALGGRRRQGNDVRGDDGQDQLRRGRAGSRLDDWRRTLDAASPESPGRGRKALGGISASPVTDTLIHYGGDIKTLAAGPHSLRSSTITAIDTHNTAQMLGYQLSRAAAMLEGSGWELKGYNRNQPRGKSSAASNRGSFVSHSGWPSDFPQIKPMTSGAKLKSHPEYMAAKAGDVEAANNVVFDLANRKEIVELGRLYPGAKIVPVLAQEATGRNKLPSQFAILITELTNLDIELNIGQSNRVHHTGADAAWRFTTRAKFKGKVEKGRDYIIADDFVTMGGTISELRQYIENNGGRVVAATSLAVSGSARTGYSGDLALQEETMIALDKKFTNNGLHDFLKEHEIYGGNSRALTNSEGRWLLSFSGLDSLRVRVSHGRDEGKCQDWTSIVSRETGRREGRAGEETEVKSLAASPITDTLIHYGGGIKTLEETGEGWRFGGWLVVFGSHDASPFKDKFTAQTDFDIENGERRGLYYNHGLDGTIKRTRLGDCRVYLKEAGVWIEGQIRKRTDYLKSHAEKIAANIESFGLSSGAPAHLVERKTVPGGHEILMWPLAEASITPTPAEPLTGCFSLKALAGSGDRAHRDEVAPATGASCPEPHPSFHRLTDGLRDGLAFDDHCARVLAAVGELQERIASLAQMRCAKSNRRWSAGKHELLEQVASELHHASGQVKSLADQHAPPPDNTAEMLQALARYEVLKARMNGRFEV